MQRTIFYSWQADHLNSTNRGFIQAALEEAARSLAAELSIEPVIERDTQGLPGSPDIARAIFSKIERSDVFVADITFINPKSAKRRTPNPNVLLELGYALHALRDDRVILVMNTAYGRVEDLPFDLKMRRTITYTMPPEETDRATERHRLAGILTSAITTALANLPTPVPAPRPVDDAVTGIEAATPNRTLLVRRAMSSITKELETLAPPLFRDKATTEQYLAAIESTTPTVAQFTLLAQTIAAMNDNESARATYRSLTPILEHYENPRGWTGTYQEADFDYWKFLGHELLVSLIAPLLNEERYEIITDILNESLTITNDRYNDGKPVEYTYASEWLRSFERLDNEHRKISYHGHVLHERHEGPLANTLPFDQFLAADYLLFLRGEIAQDPWQERGIPWVPWSSVYLRQTPPFIHTATRKAIAEKLATTLGAPDVTTLKKRLNERAGKLARIWTRGLGFYTQPLTDEQLDKIGTK